MRSFLIFAALAGLGGFYLWQKQNSPPSPSATKMAQVAAPEPTPAPRGQASEYNYMKRALDRAAEARDQARAKTDEAQRP